MFYSHTCRIRRTLSAASRIESLVIRGLDIAKAIDSNITKRMLNGIKNTETQNGRIYIFISLTQNCFNRPRKLRMVEIALADPRGVGKGAKEARLPLGPITFIFMQFSAKIC